MGVLNITTLDKLRKGLVSWFTEFFDSHNLDSDFNLQLYVVMLEQLIYCMLVEACPPISIGSKKHRVNKSELCSRFKILAAVIEDLIDCRDAQCHECGTINATSLLRRIRKKLPIYLNIVALLWPEDTVTHMQRLKIFTLLPGVSLDIVAVEAQLNTHNVWNDPIKLIDAVTAQLKAQGRGV